MWKFVSDDKYHSENIKLVKHFTHLVSLFYQDKSLIKVNANNLIYHQVLLIVFNLFLIRFLN